MGNEVELEGQVGKIVARRRPPLEGYSVELDLGQGTVELSAEFLEPIITSRQEAEALLTKTLEQDGEPEPTPSPQQDGTWHSDMDDSSDEGSESEEDVPRRIHTTVNIMRGRRVVDEGHYQYARRGPRVHGRRGPRFADDDVRQNPYDFADDSPLSGEEMPVPNRTPTRRPAPGEEMPVPTRTPMRRPVPGSGMQNFSSSSSSGTGGAPVPRSTRPQQLRQSGYNGYNGYNGPSRAQHRPPFSRGASNVATSASERTSPYNW